MAALQQVTADSIAQLAELLETAMAQAAAVTASSMVRLGCSKTKAAASQGSAVWAAWKGASAASAVSDRA